MTVHVVLPDVVSYSYEEIDIAYLRGEIPAVMANLLLLASSSSEIYSFQQTTGKLEKYTRSGDLIWGKKLNIPSQDDIRMSELFRIYSVIEDELSREVK